MQIHPPGVEGQVSRPLTWHLHWHRVTGRGKVGHPTTFKILQLQAATIKVTETQEQEIHSSRTLPLEPLF